MRVGSNQRVRGSGQTIVGSNASIIGNNNTITGSNAKVTGHGNTITGSNATVTGNNNKGVGSNATITGNNNTWQGNNCIEYGSGNVITRGQSVRLTTVNTFGGGSGVIAMGPSGKRKDIKYVEGPLSKETEHDEEASDDESCCICLTNKPICIVLPCTHVCMCVGCARTLCFEGENDAPKERGTVSCPKCRDTVKKIKRVH